MVALVVDGRARAAWIHLPVTGRTFVAEEGAGAFVDGARLRARMSNDTPTGTVYSDFMPQELRAEVVPRAWERTRLVEGPMAAAIEYTSLAIGDKDYVVYHRLYPTSRASGSIPSAFRSLPVVRSQEHPRVSRPIRCGSRSSDRVRQVSRPQQSRNRSPSLSRLRRSRRPTRHRLR